MGNEDIILTIGDIELKIPKEGNIQIRTKEGTATLDAGFKTQNKESETELTSPFTTTSTSWVDVTGLNLNAKQKTLLLKIRSLIVDNKTDLYQIASLVIQFFKP